MPRPRAAAPPPFHPYIFSRTELVRLLLAIERTVLIDPMTMRTYLLFLYGTGARFYEALNLRVSDVNFPNKLVSLRHPDGKQRRVLPVNRTVRNALDVYVQASTKERSQSDLVFVARNGMPLRGNTLRYNFIRICQRARIHQENSYSPTPGMHDLRHTFAVHCLEAWLREGKNLRQKLLVLSGYMGHANLKSTEPYLRFVPNRFVKPLFALREPSQRETISAARSPD